MPLKMPMLDGPRWHLPVAAAVVLACLGGGLFVGRDLLLPGKSTYTAQFDSALGVYKGNAVDVLGYPVGKVTAVQQRSDHVDVTIEVDGDVKVPENAQVVVTRPGIVTDRRLELTPAYRGGPTLQSGAVIGTNRTHQPVEVDQLLGSIDALLAEVTKDGSLGTAVGQSADFLDGRGRDMRAAIASLKNTSDIAADNAESISAIVSDLAVVAGTIRENRRDIRGFTRNVSAVADSLGSESDQVSETLHRLAQSMESIDRFVRENRAEALAAVDGSQTVLATLVHRIREIQETLDIMPLAFQNIGKSVDTKAGGLRVAHVWERSIFGTGLLQQMCEGDPTFFCKIGLALLSDLGVGAS